MEKENEDKIKEEILRTLLEYSQTTGKDAMPLYDLGKKVMGRQYIYVRNYVYELYNDGSVYLDLRKDLVSLTNKGKNTILKSSRNIFNLTTVGKWIIGIIGAIIAALVVAYITGAWKPSFLP